MKNTSTNIRREPCPSRADFFSWVVYQHTVKKYLLICLALGGFSQRAAVAETFYSQTVKGDVPLLYWNFDEASGNAIEQMMPAGATAVNDLVPSGASRVTHAAIGSGLFLGSTPDFTPTYSDPIIFPSISPSLFTAANPNPGVGQLGIWGVEFWAQDLMAITNSNWLSFTRGGDFTFDRGGPAPDYLEIYGGIFGRTLASGVTITDNNWHHVAWVFYGGLRASNKMDVYLDGVKKANLVNNFDRTLPLDSSIVGLNAAITVGDYQPNGGAGMIGRVDELAVYDLSSFATESALASHMDDLVARHFAAAVVPVAVPGDFDSDGDVDGADFVAWQTNFPTASGATLAQGDADGDGDVDGADFVVWQTNFPFTPGPGASPVPEPWSLTLLVMGGGLLCLRRRRLS